MVDVTQGVTTLIVAMFVAVCVVAPVAASAVGTIPATFETYVVNHPPTASAGHDKTVTVRSTVWLDGSASSDPDGDPLTYAWSIVTKPTSSRATLTKPTSVKPTFTPDRAGTYVVQLVVNDGKASSAPDTVTITVQESPYPSWFPDWLVQFLLWFRSVLPR